MTEKSLSQLRRSVLSRANAGKRVSPTDLKTLLNAEWKEQQELQTSLVNTVANLQAVEEEANRSELDSIREEARLSNVIIEKDNQLFRTGSALASARTYADELYVSLSKAVAEIEALEEDRARNQIECYCKTDTRAAGDLKDWEELSAIGEGSNLDYKDGLSISILLLGAFALLLYLI